MLWGYIAPRYLGDFVPFLVLASAVAAADIFRRLDGRRRSLRAGAVAVIAVVALFSIAANVGIAIVPNEEWNSAQVLNYVQAQKTVSDLTGHSLEANVVRGSSLPDWGPAGKLYVIGNCNGLYVSNGEDYSTVPSEQYQRATWMTVELGHAFQHTFRVTARTPQPEGTKPLPLLTAGKYTVTVSPVPTSDPQMVRLDFVARGPTTYKFGEPEVKVGSTITATLVTDPVKHSIQVTADGVAYRGTVVPFTSIHVGSDLGRSRTRSPVTDETAAAGQPTLCQSLIH